MRLTKDKNNKLKYRKFFSDDECVGGLPGGGLGGTGGMNGLGGASSLGGALFNARTSITWFISRVRVCLCACFYSVVCVETSVRCRVIEAWDCLS